MKKICFVLALLISFFTLSVCTFGAVKVPESAFYLKTADTSQYMVKITRPEDKNDTANSKSYVLCGFVKKDVANKSDLRVMLLKYDREDRKYVQFKNTDGESIWEFGSAGLFTKEIVLNQGMNNIRIVVFRNSDTDRMQLNTFKVSLVNESITDKIVNRIGSMDQILQGFK